MDEPAATQQAEELIRGLKPRSSFMLDGEIIEQAFTEEIFMRSRCKLTRDFVSGQIG